LSEVVCACCGKQRNELRVQRSRLLEGFKFVACQECKKRGFEPRYIIILVARSDGTDKVVDYIRDHKYHGDDILGRELLV
jgi:hypothetical protein